jgi:hypothetical protein
MAHILVVQKHLGSNIKKRRLELNLNLFQATIRCGLSCPHHFKDLEEGIKAVRLETINRVAEGFQVSIFSLLVGLEFDAAQANHSNNEWYGLV